ncbi:histone methyltransferase set2 [Lodderomyces elongisporus]|uniref:histone methyltransferase set2 n=1 Tax=Lodderomyces elongisporus TaxID=36914 RepID=UPI002921C221|nr:histone methyltransferase set2 [Lodderomyces elongisporus]WLF79477.1 histone methyltransferase set2 [Lodderomyces elongisporus]
MTEVLPRNGHQRQLFLDAEDKTAEALTKYQNLQQCTYMNKGIGCPSNSKRGREYMTCDCEEDWDSSTEQNMACGEDSNCINRITSVECINRHCSCGENCQNQRFQKKQYADVSVFQTELKGYGLRANTQLREGDFIYEYIGEVIDEPTFRQKMIEYDLKQYKHFYFMMLKNDAFIDATEKGSLARFVNHSCSPNAFVDKWVVADRLRMGIFAKRDIMAGEEITFDYNVDRYGAQSQPCYCGEPNCLKFMGGKTQTDAALLLPEGVSEALGVNSRIEKAWLKENKHLRSEQQADDATINEMFVKSLQVEPMEDLDVSKVIGALMKAQQQSLIKKLVERMHLTTDEYVNKLLVKFHGYKTLSSVLQEVATSAGDADENAKDDGDDELVIWILEVLARWPAITKNKISSSQIEDVVKEVKERSKNEEIVVLCEKLLQQWSQLEMAYRIPKIKNPVVTSSGFDRKSKSPTKETLDESTAEKSNGRPPAPSYRLPANWETTFDESSGKWYFYNKITRETDWNPPKGSVPVGPARVGSMSGTSRGARSHEGYPKGPSSYASHPYDSNHGHNHATGRNHNNSHNHNYNSSFQETRGPSFKHKELEITRREEERIQKEREAKAQELAAKERQVMEMIEQAKMVSQTVTPEPEKKSRHKDKRGQSSSRSDYKPKEHKSKEHKSKENSIESQWKRVLAKHIPNLIKKHQAEIGKDNVKGCAKEIVNNLARREAQKENAKSPPEELEKHKIKKIKAFTDSFMDKFLIKYRRKHQSRKRKLDQDGNGEIEGVDDIMGDANELESPVANVTGDGSGEVDTSKEEAEDNDVKRVKV